MDTHDKIQRSLVIPFWNPGDRLKETITALEDFLGANTNLEVVLVDDGSDDGSSHQVSTLHHERIRVVRHAVNKGKGAAVRSGVLAGVGRSIVFTDVDLPYGLGAVSHFFTALEEGCDMVLGSRQGHTPGLGRRAMSGVFHTVAAVALDRPVSDTQCGIKGFSREAASMLFPDLSINGFAFDVALIRKAQRANLTIREIPVQLAGSSPSTIRTSSALRALWDIVKMYGA